MIRHYAPGSPLLLFRCLLDPLGLSRTTDAALRIEVLALRHQLRVLERQVRRPHLRPGDRLILDAHSRSVLLKLGFRCSHGTVRNVLRRHGLLPAPRRTQRSWRQFIRQHAQHVLAVDFFTVGTVWLQRLHVLFFMEVGSRCVHLAGCTASATGTWMAQHARQLAWLLQDGKARARYLLRNRAAKFTASFDEVFRSEGVEVIRSEGVEVIRLPYGAPRSDCFAERWVGTVMRELLDHLLIFGCRHLDYMLREFVKHYEEARPHQGLGQRMPRHSEPAGVSDTGPVRRRDRLGGLIHEHVRQAA